MLSFNVKFLEYVTLIFDLELDTKEEALLQAINMRNMKALSLHIQNLWPLLFFNDNFSENVTLIFDLGLQSV